jgi:hypothetical protein
MTTIAPPLTTPPVQIIRPLTHNLFDSFIKIWKITEANSMRAIKSIAMIIVLLLAYYALYNSKLELIGFSLIFIIYIIFFVNFLHIRSIIKINYYEPNVKKGANNPDYKKYRFIEKSWLTPFKFIFDKIPHLYYLFSIPFIISIIIIFTILSLLLILTTYSNISSVYAPLNIPTSLDYYLYDANGWLNTNSSLPYFIDKTPIQNIPKAKNAANGVIIQDNQVQSGSTYEYVVKKDQYKFLLLLITIFIFLVMGGIDLFDVKTVIASIDISHLMPGYKNMKFVTYGLLTFLFIMFCIYGILYMIENSSAHNAMEIIFTIMKLNVFILLLLNLNIINNIITLLKPVFLILVYIILFTNIWLTYTIYNAYLPNKITTPASNQKINSSDTLPNSNTLGEIDANGFNTTNLNDNTSENPGSVIYPNAYAKPINALMNPLYWFDIRYYVG